VNSKGIEEGFSLNDGEDLSIRVSKNLKALRQDKSLSLEKLAQLSGVSRTMLNQIELCKSTPSINILWKIAKALEVPFSVLLNPTTRESSVLIKQKDSKILSSRDGKFSTRALFPFEDAMRTHEFYELKLLPHSTERANAHNPGTIENIVVTVGSMELTVDNMYYKLDAGDAILFQADKPHVYHNPGAITSVMYLVMTYSKKTGKLVEVPEATKIGRAA